MDDELLASYLSGTASPEDRARVEAWARASPDHAEELRRLEATWKGPAPGQWDVDRAWARVAPRLVVGQSATPERHRFWRQPWARAAALAALAAGAGLLWQAREARTPRSEVVATPAGEQRALELPDGSRVAVAPGSRLTVSADYGRGERRVDLEGEAWFEVRHDADRPFRVHAGGTVTEDLGTEFGIRAFATEPIVRLVVLSGSASLRRNNIPAEAAATLQANEMATLSAGAAVPVVSRGVDVAGLVAWRNGAIMLENSRLDSAVVELGRWYGLTFRLSPLELGERRLSATLRIDDLAAALDVLRLSLGVSVTREGTTVTLSAGGQ